MKRAANDRRGIAQSRGNLGMIACAEGDLAAALSLFQESLRISRELQDRRGIGAVLERIGIISCRTGDPLTGVRLMHISEREFRDLGVQRDPIEVKERAEILAQARQDLGELAMDTTTQAAMALSIDKANSLALEASLLSTPEEAV